MKVITIISDSLGMIRPHYLSKDGYDILYTNLYAHKLQKELGTEYNVVLNSKRGLTSDYLLKDQVKQDFFFNNNSNILIFHFGICDCSPRLITKLESYIILFLKKISLKFLADIYLKFKSKNRYFFTKYHRFKYVTPMKFRKNLENLDIIIRKLKGVERVFFINISDTNVINKRRSYGFEESIIQYNKIFKETFSDNSFYEIIDYYEFVDIEKDLLSDGIHLSIDGHKHITELLLKNIRC